MVRKVYAPAIDSRTRKVLYPGAAYGSELAWRALIGGPEPFGLAVEMFKYVVHQDPNWDWRTFDLSRDIEAADRQVRDTMNAEEADLSAFGARGGKLLLWHGWSDALVPPQATIDYYQRVVEKSRGKGHDFVRLFLVPGVFHCQGFTVERDAVANGGPGAYGFNSIAALERWVEAGIAPERIVAFRVVDNRVEMTRPLCPYPQVAQWRGIGTPSDAENFVCQLPGTRKPAAGLPAGK
jgi:feruloyl esterase